MKYNKAIDNLERSTSKTIENRIRDFWVETQIAPNELVTIFCEFIDNIDGEDDLIKHIKEFYSYGPAFSKYKANNSLPKIYREPAPTYEEVAIYGVFIAESSNQPNDSYYVFESKQAADDFISIEKKQSYCYYLFTECLIKHNKSFSEYFINQRKNPKIHTDININKFIDLHKQMVYTTRNKAMRNAVLAKLTLEETRLLDIKLNDEELDIVIGREKTISKETAAAIEALPNSSNMPGIITNLHISHKEPGKERCLKSW